MPKIPTPSDTAEWRKLRADGHTFKDISKRTGWQARTISKHLDTDINVQGAEDIRKEIFKDRLAEHMDLLLEGVLAPLERLGTITHGLAEPKSLKEELQAEFRNARSLKRWIASGCSAPLYLQGVQVIRNENGRLCANVNVRDTLEWSLLEQHLSGDELWSVVENWEGALVRVLEALRRLYGNVGKALIEATELEIVSDGEHESGLMSATCLLVFDWTCRRLSGEHVPEFPVEKITCDQTGDVRYSGVRLAVGTEDSSAIKLVICEFLNGQRSITGTKTVSDGQEKLKQATEELRRIVGYHRLLRYLPKGCTVCARIQL